MHGHLILGFPATVVTLGEGGNHYNMLQAAGPRPGFHQQAGGSPQLGMNSYQAQLGGASAAASVIGGVLPPDITGTNDRSTLLASNLLPEVNN
jgi:hypothetical protein